MSLILKVRRYVAFHVKWSLSSWCGIELQMTPREVSYRQLSNIRRIKSQNINVSGLVLQLPLPNPFKPGVESRMKMKLEQRRQVMLQLHLSKKQIYCLLRCAFNKRFDVSYNVYNATGFHIVSYCIYIHAKEWGWRYHVNCPTFQWIRLLIYHLTVKILQNPLGNVVTIL